jgi:hypothetical protein
MTYKVGNCDQSALEDFLNANEEEGWTVVQVWHTPVPPNSAGQTDTAVIFHTAGVKRRGTKVGRL